MAYLSPPSQPQLCVFLAHRTSSRGPEAPRIPRNSKLGAQAAAMATAYLATRHAGRGWKCDTARGRDRKCSRGFSLWVAAILPLSRLLRVVSFNLVVSPVVATEADWQPLASQSCRPDPCRRYPRRRQ